MADLREASLRHAAGELDALRGRAGNPFQRPPLAGHLRGIDFYTEAELLRAVALGVAMFARHHGRMPRVANPESWGEKVLCAKYFMPIALPTCADKLAVGRFVPPEAAGRVRLHDVVWTSPSAVLPPDGQLPAGEYWLKANHGSAMNRPFAWPPSPEERAELERLAALWLRSPYGLAWGEWWYATIERRVLLCRHVDSDGVPALDYGFYAANGRVCLVGVGTFTPDHRGETTTFYDEDWRMLEVSRAGRLRRVRERPPQFEAMLAVTRAIARGFDLIRVDFICPEQGRPLLNELTLCPASGTAVFDPPAFDYALGRRWDIGGWFGT